MEYSLSMTFVTETGDKVSMTVSGVKSDITKSEISALMDTIIAKDVFLSKNGSLTGKYTAQLTQRAVTKFDLQ
ncbi:DUF2922 domain-containing protein [Clostridium intestinale]|uniref:DUF2922 domain-containing protein n=1 Tax=Clostridium intestinale DSM 6191 TaxID=1121320 RepID=A0A1M5WN87_9CLOT|nr:DUF2922 domain-containing protein [Clostridium intestinale]SHH88483.1 Protein of unknown function [Clostridium intestinale DSM 6191]